MINPTPSARSFAEDDEQPLYRAPVRAIEAPDEAAGEGLALEPSQLACFEALSLALQEGQVFAALTGPSGSGKTLVLDAVLEARQSQRLRCIRISEPDKVPARLARQIEEVATAEASKPENRDRHVVLAIDDAHRASDELLRCLTRLAMLREPGRRVPQILVVGQPELWQRLADGEFASFARRLAIRAVLPARDLEPDPWAALQEEVSAVMSYGALDEAEAAEQEAAPVEAMPVEAMPVPRRATPLQEYVPPQVPMQATIGGLPLSDEPVMPPTDFALLPDPAPRPAGKAPRTSRRSLLIPAAFLGISVAAFAVVLTFYDWPDLFGDMPWNSSDAARPYMFSSKASTRGLPRMTGFDLDNRPSARPGSDPTAPAAVPSADAASPAAAQVAPIKPEAPSVPQPVAPAATTPSPTAAIADTPPPVLPPTPAQRLASSGAEPAAAKAPKPAPAPPAAASAVPEATRPAEAAPASVIPRDSVSSHAAAAPALRPAPAEAPASEPRQVATASEPAAGAPRIVRPAPLPSSVVNLLVRRGEEQLAIGDVFAARLLFERAAEAGSGRAALHMAHTYDAGYLSPAQASRIGDAQSAKRWYARAVSLGDKEAAVRLKTLSEGR